MVIKLRGVQNIKKQFWCSREIANELSQKTSVTGLSDSEVIRLLISNFEPREKPSQQFYESLKDLRAIGNNLNQIARKANAIDIIDKQSYQKEVEKLNDFIIELKKEFLLPSIRKIHFLGSKTLDL